MCVSCVCVYIVPGKIKARSCVPCVCVRMCARAARVCVCMCMRVCARAPRACARLHKHTFAPRTHTPHIHAHTHTRHAHTRHTHTHPHPQSNLQLEAAFDYLGRLGAAPIDGAASAETLAHSGAGNSSGNLAFQLSGYSSRGKVKAWRGDVATNDALKEAVASLAYKSEVGWASGVVCACRPASERHTHPALLYPPPCSWS